MKNRQALIFIIIITILSTIMALPKNWPVKFNLFGKNIDFKISSPEIKIGKFKRSLEIPKGLDIQGGVQLTLSADMSAIEGAERNDALTSVREVISRRVDLYGVSEPTIQTLISGDDYRIVAQLPGMQDVDSALALIGQTAQLDFRQIPADVPESSISAFPWYFYESTGLTGSDLNKATVSFNSQTSTGPGVSIVFNDQGKEKFAMITKANIGRPLAIFLDEFPVTIPVVNEEILTGEAVISGSFDIESAKQLAIQLNAGALPVPVTVIEQKTIGPTLGQDSIQKSMMAGIIGLIVVMAFMIVTYGKLGVIADIALIIYGVVTIAIYKLIPVTLSLPGIAGLVLTIGMAVDSNILIFERYKEEKRLGRPFQAAMTMAFGRAWDSIKDANLATILTALVLLNPFNFSWLVTSGSVRGFALTLLLGVFISMFTGVYASRILIRTFFKERKI